MRKKGFTLLELIVVIMILGILATLALVQYTRVLEKSRTSEAKANLGLLRQLQLANYQEKTAYEGTIGNLGTGLPEAGPACTNANYYFYYSCAATGTGTCTANRCTSYTVAGSKVAGPTYNITLDINGNWGGTTGYY